VPGNAGGFIISAAIGGGLDKPGGGSGFATILTRNMLFDGGDGASRLRIGPLSAGRAVNTQFFADRRSEIESTSVDGGEKLEGIWD